MNMASKPMARGSSGSPAVAVIMPVFGQGPILAEAIESALNQQAEFDYKIILMDDRCPMAETVETCRRYARTYPERILYWRSPVNRGLAAMRNEGIKIALELNPELVASVFFDGDDRMHPLLLQRSFEALGEARAANEGSRQVGWVFEDPDHFGIDGIMLRMHHYSALYAMAGCSNTPTSMCSADIFRAGIRFREDMKSGSEDWQFWLHCLKKGFSGHYVPNLGFRYRRRPGSMADFAYQLGERNRADIRLSHSELFNPTFYLREQNLESPRYAFIDVESGKVHWSNTGGVAGREITLHDLAEVAFAAKALPTEPYPTYVVLGRGGDIERLRAAGRITSVFWNLELACHHEHVVLGRFCQDESVGRGVHFKTHHADFTAAGKLGLICLPMKKFRALLGDTMGFAQRLEEDDVRTLSITAEIAQGADLVPDCDGALACLRDAAKAAGGPSPLRHGHNIWRPFGVVREVMERHFFDVSSIFPVDATRENILVIVNGKDINHPYARHFIEDLHLQVAADLVHELSIFVLGGEAPAWLDAVPHNKVDIVDLDPEGLAGMNGFQSECFTGALLGFETIVCLGCGGGASYMSIMRSFGHKVFGVVLMDGRRHSADTPGLALDLVHSFKVFTGILCENDNARTFALAMGVAEEQLIDTAAELIGEIAAPKEIPT